MNAACIAGTRALHGPMLESRTAVCPEWQRFLPLTGLPFTAKEYRLLLDGWIVTRAKWGRGETQFRIQKTKETK